MGIDVGKHVKIQHLPKISKFYNRNNLEGLEGLQERLNCELDIPREIDSYWGCRVFHPHDSNAMTSGSLTSHNGKDGPRPRINNAAEAEENKAN